MRGKIVYCGTSGGKRYFLWEKEVTEAQYNEAFPDQPIGTGEGLCGWKRPIESEAMAVHPDQIAEAVKRNRKHGLSVDYTPDGRPVLRDRDQRRRLMKIENMRDRDGGFGDG